MNAAASRQLTPSSPASAIEQVLVGGNLAALSPEQRVTYYNQVCESIGLNPLTRPFDYITLNGKLTLYAKRDATDQLRKINGVSIKIVSREFIEGLHVVHVQATDRTGRTDEATGAVSVTALKGEALANALLKSETKAKRRVTLSICGLGWMDETEAEGMAPPPPAPMPTPAGKVTAAALLKQAQPEREAIDEETGEITYEPVDEDDRAEFSELLAHASKIEADMLTFADREALKSWWMGLDLAAIKASAPDLYGDLVRKINARLKALKT